MFTFESPRALAMRATAPGWLSTGMVNCLVLAMRNLLVAAIIRPQSRNQYRPAGPTGPRRDPSTRGTCFPQASSLGMTTLIGRSDLLAFPAAAPEEKNSRSSDDAFGNHDG